MTRLLCVDDDADLLELKRTILEMAGYKVDTSLSVGGALAKLDETSYDAVLADWWFGKENALRLVVKAKEKNRTPVLVVSGFVEEALVSLGTAADYYMQKPVNAAELTKVLEDLIAPENGIFNQLPERGWEQGDVAGEP